MKKFFLLYLFIIFILNLAFGQAGEWVWIHGSYIPGSTGNFGVQGVPGPANDPPGVYESCDWTDLNGNFWLYGGNGVRNDLWKYNPATNEWTWMKGTNATNDPGVYGVKGIPSPSNRPPSKGYGTPTWVDLNNNLWMFGGYGTGIFNDLWKYDIATNEWTWMKGSNLSGQVSIYGIRGVADTANCPGAHAECSSTWTDSAGDLWIFGGEDGSNNSVDEMWRYSIASNTWTWMKGSIIPNLNPVYGTIGVEDSLNTPGARKTYNHWKDSNGNLWIFGGNDNSSINYYNDLWRYNIITNNWTWMNGNNTGNTTAVYGTKCQTSPLVIPGGRFENRANWTDVNGDFWFFGGGLNGSVVWNDLWKYCVSTNQWAWISGDSISNPSGIWGTIGVANPLNHPDGRWGSVGWTDNNNHLYLFGGFNQSFNANNDLWKYTIDPTCAPCAANTILPTANFISSDSVFCSGDCINFTNLSQYSNSYHWLFSGGIPSTDSSANPHGICYFNSGTFDVTLIATNNNGSDTLTLSNFITVFPQIPFSALTQNGDTLFSIPGYPSYEWYDGSTLITGANSYSFVATHSGNYSVVVTDSNGCFASAQKLNVIASVNNISSDIIDFNVQYSSGNLLLKINSSKASLSDIEITDGIGKIIYQKKITVENGKNEFEIPGLILSRGVYFIKLMNSKQSMTKKIFID